MRPYIPHVKSPYWLNVVDIWTEKKTSSKIIVNVNIISAYYNKYSCLYFGTLDKSTQQAEHYQSFKNSKTTKNKMSKTEFSY